MNTIRIKDKETLLKIFRAISWFDHIRWLVPANYNFMKFFREDLTNCEKILSHWICYITDRQMPYEVIWDKGARIFSELVYDYMRNPSLAPKKILTVYYREKKKEKSHYYFTSSDGSVTFASRYITNDYQNIKQTLEILDHQKYNRNIVAFIIDIIKRFPDKDDLLVRVACALHLLTYQLNGRKANSPKNRMNIFKDNLFEKSLETFKKSSTTGKKRLWCSIRDYKKGLYNSIFIDAIKEITPSEANEIITIWNNLPMSQIELPGDVWNNNPLFRDNLFANAIDLESIPKTWAMPDIVRNLYEQLKEIADQYHFYPEQFDFTFDFVPRMCEKKFCHLCPFGPDGIDKTCIPSENKYCPVALFSCGYTAICNGKDCELREGLTKGLCKSEAGQP